MVIEGADAVLHIGIVADVFLVFPVVIGLVVLVEVIHHLEVVAGSDVPFAPETAAEVAIAIWNDRVLLVLTEEIPKMTDELQVIDRPPYEAVLYIPCLATIHLTEFAVVIHIGTDSVGVDICMLHTRDIIETPFVESEEAAIALFLMVSPTGIDIQHPRLL